MVLNEFLCTVGNIGNFWLITKSRFYTNLGPKSWFFEIFELQNSRKFNFGAKFYLWIFVCVKKWKFCPALWVGQRNNIYILIMQQLDSNGTYEIMIIIPMGINYNTWKIYYGPHDDDQTTVHGHDVINECPLGLFLGLFLVIWTRQ